MSSKSLLSLIFLENILLSIKIVSMLGVNDGPIIADDHIAIQILGNAVNKIVNVGIGNCFLLELMGDFVSQMPHLLEPAVQEISELLPSVLEFSFFLLVVLSTEVFGERSTVDLFIIVEGMEGSITNGNGVIPLGVVHEGSSHVKEVVNLNGGETEEDSSGFQGTVDAMDDMIEVVYPVQTEEAVCDIVLGNIIQFSLNIPLLKIYLRVVLILALVEADHIL